MQFSWSGKAFEFNSTGSSYFQIALIIRNRAIIKITNKKKSVYCEFLKIDENYLEKYNNGRTLKIENPSNTIIANEWYRTRLGIKKTNQDENITIQPANNLIGKLCASLQHPQLIVRISTKLGLLSFGLGLISLFN